MNMIEFKTYEEFKNDMENEILEDLDDEEKFDYYNRYCEYNNNPDSMIYYNDDDFLDTFFDGNASSLAKAIAYGDYEYNDEYVRFDGCGNLQSYNGLQDALEDNFVDSELIDFIMEDKDIDLESSYNEYICDTLDEARDKMTPEEFLDALKEYTTREMIKKYPEVYDNIEYSYSDDILDENDRNESKDIANSFER